MRGIPPPPAFGVGISEQRRPVPLLFGTSLALSCDWNGDGIPTPGQYHPDNLGQWNIGNGRPGSGDTSGANFYFGPAGGIPVCGDWNNDTVETPGVFKAGVWYLTDTNVSTATSTTPIPASATFTYGRSGDIPVAGDWNNDGYTTPALVRPSGSTASQWLLRNSNSAGSADITLTLTHTVAGPYQPVVGNWNTNGPSNIGVVSPAGHWQLRDTLTSGPIDEEFDFGTPGDTYLTW